jgi:hypothetical protein
MSASQRLDIGPDQYPAGREEVLQTDQQLQTGTPPQKVTRLLFANNTGTTLGQHAGGFPETQDDAVIVHQLVSRRQSQAVLTPPTFDDGAFIPAVYVGNPR